MVLLVINVLKPYGFCTPVFYKELVLVSLKSQIFISHLVLQNIVVKINIDKQLGDNLNKID